jgi:2-hydroxychromene-2-carboxylate isomerase
MPSTIIYFHSLSSPWAYLGGPRFHEIARRHGASVVSRSTTIVPENGGIRLGTRPDARRAYHEVELDRWRNHLGIPLNLRPKYYPTDPQYSARMVVAADLLGHDVLELSHALRRAIWADEQDVTDPGVRIAVADRLGLDGRRLQAMEEEPRVRAAWEASHAEAVERGVFGTPTYVYRDQLYWGQDRLDFLDRALGQAEAAGR